MPPPSATPEAIITLLQEHDILSAEERILTDSDLFSLGLDSLALMQLLLHLESSFEVKIPSNELIANHFKTPSNIATWINQLQVEAAP